MADVGPSQRRGRHSDLSRTGQGQTITPQSGEGESYDSPTPLLKYGNDVAAQRRGLNSILSPTGQGQTELPMSGQGESYERPVAIKSNHDSPSYSPSTVYVAYEGCTGSETLFLMRGWRPLHVPPDYELWIAVGSPNTSNPSGEPIQDITVQSSWDEPA